MIEGLIYLFALLGIVYAGGIFRTGDDDIDVVKSIVLGGLAGGVTGLIMSLIFSFAWWFLSTFWLPIIGVTAVIMGIVYWVRNPEVVASIASTIAEVLQTQCELLVAHIKLSDRLVLNFATKQTKRLVAIAPDLEWMDIRTSISELGTRHIPDLLRERRSLRSAIGRVQGVLKHVAWQKLDRKDFEKANARRSAQNIEALVVRLQKNEDDLKEALDTFRHLEADLALATVDTYKCDEIKKQLRGLVSRIEQNAIAVDEARTETDDYAHQRPRRLTE